MRDKVHWRSALVGGLVAGLVVAAAPSMAAIGEALILGQNNSANGRTNLSGSVASTNLRIENTHPDGAALSLAVQPGNPPLKVASPTKVQKLNADKVDGRSAHQLVRVASRSGSNLPDGDGDLLTTQIKAPTDGYLVLNASLYIAGTAEDSIRCSIAVAKGGGTTFVGTMDVVVHDAGGDHTNNRETICSPTGVLAVEAGTYDVSMRISFWTSANLERGNLWALFVPFDGVGKPPVLPDVE